jgi:hypothetical protein
MWKVVFPGLILAFGLSVCVLTASSADVAELLERAKRGEPDAQYGPAERYRKVQERQRISKNAEEAEQKYRKAAETGTADVQSAPLFV